MAQISTASSSQTPTHPDDAAPDPGSRAQAKPEPLAHDVCLSATASVSLPVQPGRRGTATDAENGSRTSSAGAIGVVSSVPVSTKPHEDDAQTGVASPPEASATESLEGDACPDGGQPSLDFSETCGGQRSSQLCNDSPSAYADPWRGALSAEPGGSPATRDPRSLRSQSSCAGAGASCDQVGAEGTSMRVPVDTARPEVRWQHHARSV